MPDHQDTWPPNDQACLEPWPTPLKKPQPELSPSILASKTCAMYTEQWNFYLLTDLALIYKAQQYSSKQEYYFPCTLTKVTAWDSDQWDRRISSGFFVVTEELTRPGSYWKHPPSLPGSPCRVVPSLNKQSCGLPKSGQEQGQQRNGLSAPRPGCVDHQRFCCKI